MTEELWAARDPKGKRELHLFKGEPSLGLRRMVFIGNTWCDYLTEIDLNLLPDLKPGEKCRVRIARVDEQGESHG